MFIGLRQFRFVIISSLVFAVVGCGHKQHTSPSHKVSSASLSLSPLSPFTPNSQASVQSTDFKTELSQALGAQAGGSVYSQQSLTITANGIGSGLHNFNISGQYLQITDAKNCSATFSGPGDAQRSCVVHVQPSSSTAVDSTETTSLHATADDSDSHLVSAPQAVIIKAKTQPKPGALGITVAPAPELNFSQTANTQVLKVSLANCVPGQDYTLSLANKQSSSSSSWLELASGSTTVTCGAEGSVQSDIALQADVSSAPTTSSKLSFNLKAQGSSQDPSQGQQALSAQLHASWTVDPPAKTKLTLMVTDTATPPHSGAQDDPIPLSNSAAEKIKLSLQCAPASQDQYPLGFVSGKQPSATDSVLKVVAEGGSQEPGPIQCGKPVFVNVSIASGKSISAATEPLNITVNKGKSSSDTKSFYFKAGGSDQSHHYMFNLYHMANEGSATVVDPFNKTISSAWGTAGSWGINSTDDHSITAFFLTSTQLPSLASGEGAAFGGWSMNGINNPAITSLISFLKLMGGSSPAPLNATGDDEGVKPVVDLDFEQGPGGLFKTPVTTLFSGSGLSGLTWADFNKAVTNILDSHYFVDITMQEHDVESCEGSPVCIKNLQSLLYQKGVYLQPMAYYGVYNTITSQMDKLISGLGTGYANKILFPVDFGVSVNEKTNCPNSCVIWASTSGNQNSNVESASAYVKTKKLAGVFFWTPGNAGDSIQSYKASVKEFVNNLRPS